MIEWIKNHIWSLAGVILVSIVMLVAVTWGKKQTPKSVHCQAIVYEILDSRQRMYVDEDQLNLTLAKAGLYPVDRPLSELSLSKMEQTFKDHPMIETAECFLQPDNVVKVQLTQRVPLLRVDLPKDTFLIDAHRKRMEYRPSVQDKVLLVKGNVDEELASTQLADLAQWLKGNGYWRNRIDSVVMVTPEMMHLYIHDKPLVKIIMGEIEGYDTKLAKLKTYMENGQEATKDKNYTELDLRFKDQVVGRK